MEREGTMVAVDLPGSIETVEEQQRLPVSEPFRVYVCSSQEEFNAYMGAPPGATARGVKVLNDIFLSPRAFDSRMGDTHEGVLTHELSHLHLYQRMGYRRMLWDTPPWFLEGLAVMVSGDGGPGVTESDAREAILAGHHFTADDAGSLLRQKRAADYGMDTYMFYRQSELFVRFLRDEHSGGFEEFLLRLQNNEGSFADAFRTSFGADVPDMWEQFESHLRSRGAR